MVCVIRIYTSETRIPDAPVNGKSTRKKDFESERGLGRVIGLPTG